MQKPSRSSGGFLIGNACILLATIFWGVNVSVTKALIPDWMTANGIAAVRLIGGAVLLWLTSLFVRCDRIKRGDWPRLVLGGVVGLFLFIFLFVTSLRYGNPIDISIIMTLPPVFVILIGVIFQHRRPSMLEYVGVAVSFAGAVIVILAGQGGQERQRQSARRHPCRGLDTMLCLLSRDTRAALGHLSSRDNAPMGVSLRGHSGTAVTTRHAAFAHTPHSRGHALD